MKISTLPKFVYKFMLAQSKSNGIFLSNLYYYFKVHLPKKKEAGSALQGSKSKQPNQELKFQEGECLREITLIHMT